MTSLEVATGRPFTPDKPNTRIYVAGYEYKLVTPYLTRPPLANTIKLILNWVNDKGRPWHNIMYGLFGTSVDTTSDTLLLAAANAIMSSFAGAGFGPILAPTTTLSTVTAKDNSGMSEASQTSTHAAYVGTGTAAALPPQCCLVLSWQIAASYRGGKPRTYLSGLDQNVLTSVSDSLVNSSEASTAETAANNFESSVNSSSPGGNDMTLGTISYQTHNAPRPTPIFRVFDICRVHERIDSQRRRSGKESAFGSVP